MVPDSRERDNHEPYKTNACVERELGEEEEGRLYEHKLERQPDMVDKLNKKYTVKDI